MQGKAQFGSKVKALLVQRGGAPPTYLPSVPWYFVSIAIDIRRYQPLNVVS